MEPESDAVSSVGWKQWFLPNAISQVETCLQERQLQTQNHSSKALGRCVSPGACVYPWPRRRWAERDEEERWAESRVSLWLMMPGTINSSVDSQGVT